MCRVRSKSVAKPSRSAASGAGRSYRASQAHNHYMKDLCPSCGRDTCGVPMPWEKSRFVMPGFVLAYSSWISTDLIPRTSSRYLFIPKIVPQTHFPPPPIINTKYQNSPLFSHHISRDFFVMIFHWSIACVLVVTPMNWVMLHAVCPHVESGNVACCSEKQSCKCLIK